MKKMFQHFNNHYMFSLKTILFEVILSSSQNCNGASGKRLNEESGQLEPE